MRLARPLSLFRARLGLERAAHTLFVRVEPEAKVVIFSAWIDALDLLMESFTRNGLKFVRLEGANGKGKKEGVAKIFQESPDVAAFFLVRPSFSISLSLVCVRRTRP